MEGKQWQIRMLHEHDYSVSAVSHFKEKHNINDYDLYVTHTYKTQEPPVIFFY